MSPMSTHAYPEARPEAPTNVRLDAGGRARAIPGPLGQALWYIESHLSAELSLCEIADVAGASPFYLTRAFGIATGHSIMRYARARRLSEAARWLAAGAPDILVVALDAGYGSHEAFTRAFREHFGQTPEAVREAGATTIIISLLEPLHMNERPTSTLDAARVEDNPVLLLAGLKRRYSYEASARIPGQWQDFGPHIGNIAGQHGLTAFGVCPNGDEAGNIDYLSAVEVTDFSRLPDDLATLRLPARRYAVFTHAGQVSTIRSTWNAIFEAGRQSWASGSPTARSSSIARPVSIPGPEAAVLRSGFWLIEIMGSSTETL